MNDVLVTNPPEVEQYLADVRALLADLPPDEIDEVLDDLEGHLLEVRADSDQPLTTLIGAPAEFARELRASAGLTPVVPGPAKARNLRSLVSVRVTSLLDRPGIHQIRDFAPELRPGWWVLRGVIAVYVLAAITSGEDRHVPWPKPGGSALIGTMALGLAVYGSVRLGRWTERTGKLRRLFVVGTVGLLGLAALSSHHLFEPSYVYVETDTLNEYLELSNGGLLRPDGEAVSNLYVYDTDGNLLEGVLVYDQAGRPVEGPVEVWTDQGRIVSQFALDANGAPIRNGFPLEQQLVESFGATVAGSVLRPPAVVIPRAAAEAPGEPAPLP